MERQISQTKAIEKDLKAGKKISPRQAIRDYSCMRLSARIFELKQRGLRIQSKLARAGDMVFSIYWLDKKRTA